MRCAARTISPAVQERRGTGQGWPLTARGRQVQNGASTSGLKGSRHPTADVPPDVTWHDAGRCFPGERRRARICHPKSWTCPYRSPRVGDHAPTLMLPFRGLRHRWPCFHHHHRLSHLHFQLPMMQKYVACRHVHRQEVFLPQPIQSQPLRCSTIPLRKLVCHLLE